MYVADAGNNQVSVVSATGTVTPFATTYAGTPFAAPSGVAVDLTGNIYIADSGNNRVVEISATGVYSLEGFTGLSNPKGIAVDGAGDLFVADAGNNRVVELTPAGVQSAISVSPSPEYAGGRGA